MVFSRQASKKGVISSILAIAVGCGWGTAAQANCADSIGRLDYFKPAMERRWNKFRQQKTFPWGTDQLFKSLDQNRVVLAQGFAKLTGDQKQQVIAALGIDNGSPSLFDDLTSEERQQPGIGALPPYQVFLEDGRLLFTAYDGCTPKVLLTERDRYSYYYTRRPDQGGKSASISSLRNAGQPFWRKVKGSIGKEKERQTRLQFWNTVGYDKAQKGWWIAWVPEAGQFEINISSVGEQEELKDFWAIASREFPFQVVLRDGSPILNR